MKLELYISNLGVYSQNGRRGKVVKEDEEKYIPCNSVNRKASVLE